MSRTRTSTTRLVVPTERHVERLGLLFGQDGARGVVAETRSSLLRRLVDAFCRGAVWASPEVTRLALTESLRAALWEDPLLGPLVRAGGTAYLRTVELVDGAIGELRRAATPLAVLERADKQGGGAGLRASTLRRAIVALDQTLEARGLIDARAQGRVLADVLGRVGHDEIVAVVGSRELVARHLVAWDAADLAWWRALGARLARAGGRAIIELPAFDKADAALDAARDRDPLEILFDDLLARLDEPPATSAIAPVLGDLVGTTAPPEPARLAVVAAADATRQARAVAHAVRSAIAEGAPIDRIAVAIPRIDEDVLVPLRAAFEEAGLPLHEPRGAPPTASAIVATALEAHALASRGLPRLDVAMLLRSRYVDAPKLTDIEDRAHAKRVLLDVADALEAAPMVAGSDVARALEETIVMGARGHGHGGAGGGEALRPVAKRIADTLAAVELAKTRSAHARAARALWDGLGFPARVSLDARYTLASDDVPEGIARAELASLAHDAHGWRVLMDALEAYAAAAAALGASGSAVTSEVFRHELARTLEAGAPRPGAGRVGAVRVVRMNEVAGEPLAHLFVLDANEGVLPPGETSSPLLTDALVTRLRTMDASASPVAGSVMRARELAHVAMAASQAERVTLFHRDAGRDGEALAPAPLALSLVRAGARHARAGGGVLVDAPLSAREEQLQALAAGEAARDEEAAQRARVERAREKHHGAAKAGDVVSADAIVGQLAIDAPLAALMAEELGHDRALPVTSLERFARCAFQGYAHQILGARDTKVASETLDAREAGTLVHEALAEAMRAAAPLLARRPVDPDAVRALAMEAADRVLRRGTESALRSLAIDLARERVLRVVDWTLAQDEWVFALAEQSFGDDRAPHEGEAESWPPLVIGTGERAVRLRGSIDRVDVARDDGARPRRVRVIDYKSSAATVKEAKKELGSTMLQVPLYALAARDAFGASWADGMYLPVAELDPRFGEDAGLAKKWAEVTSDDAAPLRERVLELMEQVRSGALAPIPEHESFCDTCSLDGVCRRPRFVSSEEPGEGGDGEGGA